MIYRVTTWWQNRSGVIRYVILSILVIGMTAFNLRLIGYNPFHPRTLVIPMELISIGLCMCIARGYRKPIKTTLCFHCGYDLRATRDRCPECGKTPGEK